MKFSKLAIAIIVLILSSITWGQDQEKGKDKFDIPNFTATQVFPSGKADMAMKVYRSGSSVRVERSRAMSTLYVPASGKVYNFTTYPDKSRQCVAMKPAQAKMIPSPLAMLQGPILKRTPLGTEVVEGHNCKVENVEVVQLDGKTVESKVWEAEDLNGIPVKIESHVEGITLRAVYRDVAIGAPDQELFTVPEKCTPFERTWQVAEMMIIK